MTTRIGLSNTIAFETIIEGGYTTNLKGLKPEGGYMVSMHKEHELTIDLEDVRKDINLLISNLQLFMRKHEELLEASKDLYIGSWIDKGLVYIDISTNVSMATVANRAAVQHQQIEFYGVKEQKSFKTFYPDRIKKVEFYTYAPELNKVHLLDGTVIKASGIGREYSWEQLAELVVQDVVNKR